MARAYQSSDQVYAVFGELWRQLVAIPELAELYARTPLTVAFLISNPDAQIIVSPGRVDCGASSTPPDVRIILDADIAHEFWLQRLTLPTALLTGRMRISGAMQQLTRLPALLRPGYSLYADLCRAHGVPTGSR
jgi:hypothetical protein